MGIYIFGSAGFAREVYSICERLYISVDAFVDVKEGGFMGGYIGDIPIISENKYDINKPVVVAVGNPSLREKIVNKILTKNSATDFPILIDPSAQILSPRSVFINRGTIICAGSILTCDIVLGEFTNLNLGTTIGHDCKLDSYFTTAPLVAISGFVKTGKKVYFGTNSSCKENINITDNVTIGMGGIVTKNITESGVYIGVPVDKK